MNSFKYLIVGGGIAADAAVQGIRQIDREGRIGIISAEPNRPYDRPPLTKGLWKDNSPKSIWRHAAAENAELFLGRTARELSFWRRQVTDDQGAGYRFEKLLLATGARPRFLPSSPEAVLYYRTLEDFQRLRTLTEYREQFAIIGAGFIGAELAASLASIGKRVTMIFPGPGIGANIFPADLVSFLNDYYRQKGVDLLSEEKSLEVQSRKERAVVRTQSGKQLEFDAVVAGVGVEPNIELARDAGLRVENGIVVDEYLCTSHPEVYAAGDVAAFYSPALSRRLRVEHEDNAQTMGQWAGRNMAGIPHSYNHLPSFYSDLFDLGYEAVGELDPRRSTIAHWEEPFRKGTVYYHRQGQVRGVLLWNVWGQVEKARELITAERRFQPQELESGLLKVA